MDSIQWCQIHIDVHVCDGIRLEFKTVQFSLRETVSPSTSQSASAMVLHYWYCSLGSSIVLIVPTLTCHKLQRLRFLTYLDLLDSFTTSKCHIDTLLYEPAHEIMVLIT